MRNQDFTPHTPQFPDVPSELWQMHKQQLLALQRIEMQLAQLVALQRGTAAPPLPPEAMPG